MATRKRAAKRSQGHVQAGLVSREISASGVPRRSGSSKATSLVALARATSGPRAVKEPVHVRNLLAREPGDPMLACPADRGQAVQGRPMPYAWDVRVWEVGSPHSTDEATEQGRAAGCGGGGGKEVRQEKLGRPITSRTQSRVRRVKSGRSGPAAVEQRLQGALITSPSQQTTVDRRLERAPHHL